VIRVETDSERSEQMAAFAKHCFFQGDVPARDGGTFNWVLDCRHGLGNAVFARDISSLLLGELQGLGIRQIVGRGFGAYILIGAMLALRGDLSGGLLRERGKSYGRGRILEGDLNRDEPVCVVDDIINSGRTACRTVDLLHREGYLTTAHISVFCFDWGVGCIELQRRGVQCKWLATVSKPGLAGGTIASPAPVSAWLNGVRQFLQRLIRSVR